MLQKYATEIPLKVMETAHTEVMIEMMKNGIQNLPSDAGWCFMRKTAATGAYFNKMNQCKKILKTEVEEIIGKQKLFIKKQCFRK
jgi:hypothetical protein